jgi:hypothetical protein
MKHELILNLEADILKAIKGATDGILYTQDIEKREKFHIMLNTFNRCYDVLDRETWFV